MKRSFAATDGLSGALVVSGWFLAHWLTARRELTAGGREARINALEATFMRAAIPSIRPLTAETIEKPATLISMVQLYGTRVQTKLMARVVDAFAHGKTVFYDAILADLRDTVQKGSRLWPVASAVWLLRLATNSVPLQPDPLFVMPVDENVSL